VHNGFEGEEKLSLIIPRDELRGGVMLYLHGGGYTCGSIEYARGFASVLSAECGMRVLTVEYGLAPENPYPAAVNDALMAYDKLTSSGVEPSKIVLVGESAGGGLCYALLLKLRERGSVMPAGVIAISPWVDLTLSGDSYLHNREADPSLSRERLEFFADCYVGAEYATSSMGQKGDVELDEKTQKELAEKKSDPMVSPLFADMTGFPPSLIFVGEDEILLSDAISMKERLESFGASSELVTRREMWHAYILYCLKSNKGDFVTMSRFLKRVLPEGNERKLRWMHLDNAAKIYPASATSRWNNIYRLSATLKEEVDKEILQHALDVTVRRFPSIAVRLHRGMFWYYLEEIPHAPRVKDEMHSPLIRMPFDDIRSCAFRVLVYKKRIAVEFFHALTDGNGGLIFLKTLVAEYLTQKYGAKIPATDGVLDRLEEPDERELEDCFPKHKSNIGKTRNESDSYRIYGTPEEDGFCHDTTFIMDPKELLSVAHKYGVTLTALLTACFIQASIRLQTEDGKPIKKQKKVKVLIPCDLRRIYGEETLRNFALYATPGVDPRLGEYSFGEICSIVHHKMALEISEKNLSAMIYTNVKDEENILLKLAPLFLKNIVMKLVFFAVGERKSTLSLSNLGVVKLPKEMDEYIDRFDFVLGVQATAPYNAGVISYKDKLYLNIIRDIKEPRLEYALYKVLRENGIKVKVESNDR